jgi:outer membrane protein OmpA-like peptidoglycan-associated protein
VKHSKLLLAGVVLLASTFSNADEDSEGCKDYPMFNRMPNYYIAECESKQFDAYNFTVENSTSEDAKTESVEGKFYYHYQLNSDSAEPSALQIFRNYENALKQINAKIMGKVIEQNNSYSFICAKVTKGKNEVWIKLTVSQPDYEIVILEKENMTQSIQAKDILDALNTSGYIALDILFDTGKATVKPESQDIVNEIFNLLKSNTSLKVSIEGHTDNVGDAAGNKKLSEQRAKTVMDILIAKGIGKDRLSSIGWGQEKPVADNRTEEGRTKNRRVEIVKK